MRITDEQLADYLRVSLALRNDALGEKRARGMQRKIHDQTKEINRLQKRVRDLELLSHSRGQLLLDIQKHALEKQVNG